MDIESFSDEQLAGQRIVAGFNGTEINDDLKYLIGSLQVAGIILFTRNLGSPDEITELCCSVQEFTASCGQPPLIIAIDQEGGEVARLKEPFTQFPGGNPEIKDIADAAYFADITASELKPLGVNMNMAPVMDVDCKDIDSIMARRVFGSDPIHVSRLGTKVIEVLQKNRIMAVAKHFPGIGRTTLDSHVDLPFLETAPEEMKATDFIPFKAAINNNVAGIMLSHISYTMIDRDWPASLSKIIANDLLREEMGFENVVMTDDLDMGAINKYYDMKTIVAQILEAEIDIALICHKGPDIQNLFDEILQGLKSSDDIKKKGIESVQRILNLKKEYLT